MRVAVDTNLLAYAEGVNGPDREAEAIRALMAHDDDDVFIPAQALGELFAVLTRKLRLPASEARMRVLQWSRAYPVLDTTVSVLRPAMELVVAHRIGFWDAVMMAAAAATECDLLLSEDMQDSFTWRGVTVRNPLRAS